MRTGKENKKQKPSMFTLLSGVFMALVLILAFLLAGTRLVGLTPYAVISGSMEPEYPVGSLIYVDQVEPSEISIGDPITFVMNESLMVATHRVVDIKADGSFITKGDANDTVDGTPVHPKNLLGRPQFSLPYLGYVSVFLASRQGRVVLLGALVILILTLLFPDGKSRVLKKEVAD